MQIGALTQNSQAVTFPQTINVKKLPELLYSVAKSEGSNTFEKKISRIAWFIFSIIVFPIGIVRLIRKAINHVVTKKFLLPALNLNKAELDAERAKMMGESDFQERCERFSVETADSIQLDTLIIHHPNQKDHKPSERKFLIFLNGNQRTYENSFHSLKKISDETGFDVLCGNYRGVGCSEGFPSAINDLIRDAEAWVKYLFSMGVKKDNILIHGYSTIGGGIGTQIASSHSLSFCGDRISSSLSKQVKELCHLKYEQNKDKGTIAGRCKAIAWRIFTPFIVKSIRLSDWNFNCMDSYLTIQKHKFLIYHHSDSCVPYSSSLYKKLKDLKRSTEEKYASWERKLQKIRCRLNKEEYLAPKIERAYRPQHAIRLDQRLEKTFAHVISLEDTAQFDDYKSHASFALG